MDTNGLHLIIGTGPLGQRTARALLEERRRVRMLNRSGQLSVALDGVEVVKGDLSTPEHAMTLLHGAAMIYQCAQPSMGQSSFRCRAVGIALTHAS
jgi:uncharacterized protein YbjT (DUF2867 family)